MRLPKKSRTDIYFRRKKNDSTENFEQLLFIMTYSFTKPNVSMCSGENESVSRITSYQNNKIT